MKRSYDIESIKKIHFFENLTKAKVKDMILGNTITLIIEPGDMGRALGKKGATLKRVEELFKKKVRVVEYSDDLATFVKHLCYPAEIERIEQEQQNLTIVGKDRMSKGILLGRDKKNLARLKEIINRFFSIDEVKVE